MCVKLLLYLATQPILFNYEPREVLLIFLLYYTATFILYSIFIFTNILNIKHLVLVHIYIIIQNNSLLSIVTLKPHLII